jgi:hypothetical protein
VNPSVPAYVGGISTAPFVPAALTASCSVVCELPTAGDCTPFISGVEIGPVISPPDSDIPRLDALST